MPRFLEKRLQAEAASKGLTGRRADQYTYGAMNNQGYMRGNVETPAGKALQAKHVRDVAAGTAAPLKASPSASAGPADHPIRNLGKFAHPRKP